MVHIAQLESTGFLRVEGRAELSYADPRIILTGSTLMVGRPETHVRGTYRGGAALEIYAISRRWLQDAICQKGRHRLTLRGTGIARVLNPETDKDGISTCAVDYLNLIVEISEVADLQFETVVGDCTFGRPGPRISGLFLVATLKLELEQLRQELGKLAY